MGAPSHDVVEVGTAIAATTSHPRAIDVGCGPGRNALYLRSIGYDVVGVEANTALVRQAAAHQSALGLDIELVNCAIESAHLSGEFDLCLLLGILHFLPKKTARDVVGRMQAMTPHGGVHLVTISYNRYPLPRGNALEKQGHLNSVSAHDIAQWYRNWTVVASERYTKWDSHRRGETDMHPINKFVFSNVKHLDAAGFTTTKQVLTRRQWQSEFNQYLTADRLHATTIPELRARFGHEDVYHCKAFATPQLSFLSENPSVLTIEVAFWGTTKCYFERGVLTGYATYDSAIYHHHTQRAAS